MKTLPLLLALLLTLLVAACVRPVRVQLPEPVRPPNADLRTPDDQPLLAARGAGATSLTRTPTPELPETATNVSSGVSDNASLPPLRGQPINVNIEGVPVPAFINEFFGNILGVGFQLDPAVAKLNDLVTLRTAGPQSPQNFYRLAVEVLRTYGISTTYEGGRVLFKPSAKGGEYQPPLVLSGRALPDVPITHRPVFQQVQLQSVRVGDVAQWLRVGFKNAELQIIEDLNRNAVVLYGKPDDVAQAAAAIRVFDQPYMRGRVSVRLEPAFVSAGELGKRLVDVMTAEGYGASLNTGQAVQAASVVVLPIEESNAVIVFASDRSVLEHAVEWSRSIDQPNPAAGGDGLFYYLVQNTRAEDIVQTLNGVRAGGAPSDTRAPVRDAVSSAQAGGLVPPTTTVVPPNGLPALPPDTAAATLADGNLAGGKLVLDRTRNALIFQGAAADWSRLLSLIKQMDKAPRQVMIEVTIAEVTLGKDQNFGVSWLAHSNLGRFNGTVTSGTLGGGTDASGSSAGGLTYLLDIAGQARAQLRAYANDNKVTVLSTPRLLVKSGEEASIDVGTEVPTITTQTAATQQTGGTSNLLQAVQYRKTGIILNIKPVVYSDNRIDLEIRQEVSEALPLDANSPVQSPSIFNRAVSTNLSLRDGSSILIGGLISTRGTNSNGGVPYLKDIPVLGNLFKNTTHSNSKTELILMIVPYIVGSDEQATSLTRSLGNQYDLLQVPVPQEPGPTITPSKPVEQTSP